MWIKSYSIIQNPQWNWWSANTSSNKYGQNLHVHSRGSKIQLCVYICKSSQVYVVISESCLISQYELNKCFRNLVFMGFFTSLYALLNDFIAHIEIFPFQWKCPVTKSTTCQKVLTVILQKGIFAMLPSRESIFLFSIFFALTKILLLVI
jgi:hypothetical protein